MTTLAVTLVAVLATWAATVAEIGLGEAGLAVPSVGLIIAAVAGGQAPAYRLRWLAVMVGCVAGVTVEGGMLMVPAVYLILAYGVGLTARAFALESTGALAIVGVTLALLHEGAFLLFRVPGRLTMLTDTRWVWAGAGIVLTAAGFVVAQRFVARMPRLRHALERP